MVKKKMFSETHYSIEFQKYLEFFLKNIRLVKKSRLIFAIRSKKKRGKFLKYPTKKSLKPNKKV